MNIFWGMKIMWIFFEVTTELGVLRGHFYAIKGLLLRPRYRTGGIFLSLKFQIFFWGA